MAQSNNGKCLQSELLKFKIAFESLIPRNPTLLNQAPIFLAVQAKLRSSGLYDLSPLDILYDVWVQGVQSIERGNPIHKPDGWVYTVALRVIAKKVKEIGQNRKKRRFDYDSVANEQITTDHDDDFIETEEKSLQYDKLNHAIQQLNEQDREILEFTLLDRWSYAEITEYKTRQGSPPVELSALRQQKRRAMKKLRKLYHKVEA